MRADWSCGLWAQEPVAENVEVGGEDAASLARGSTGGLEGWRAAQRARGTGVGLPLFLQQEGQATEAGVEGPVAAPELPGSVPEAAQA